LVPLPFKAFVALARAVTDTHTQTCHLFSFLKVTHAHHAPEGREGGMEGEEGGREGGEEE